MSEKTKAHLQFFGLMVLAGFIFALVRDLIEALS